MSCYEWYADHRNKLSINISLSLFMLFILSLWYFIINILNEYTFLPIDSSSQPWIKRLSICPVILTIVISLFIFLTYPPKGTFAENTKNNN